MPTFLTLITETDDKRASLSRSTTTIGWTEEQDPSAQHDRTIGYIWACYPVAIQSSIRYVREKRNNSAQSYRSSVTPLGAWRPLCASLPKLFSTLSPEACHRSTSIPDVMCTARQCTSGVQGVPRVYRGWVYTRKGTLPTHQGGRYTGLYTTLPTMGGIPGYIHSVTP